MHITELHFGHWIMSCSVFCHLHKLQTNRAVRNLYFSLQWSHNDPNPSLWSYGNIRNVNGCVAREHIEPLYL
jgi:hypothetical protein